MRITGRSRYSLILALAVFLSAISPSICAALCQSGFRGSCCVQEFKQKSCCAKSTVSKAHACPKCIAQQKIAQQKGSLALAKIVSIQFIVADLPATLPYVETQEICRSRPEIPDSTRGPPSGIRRLHPARAPPCA